MDKTSISTSWDRAKQLYDKNAELENKRRKLVQARVPSDPNAWYQMRENYEAIILEDHAFSEQHNIEYALWQLHYKRIEEFRAHFSAAQASNRASASSGARTTAQPDRVMKIRVQFKAFLSEATGFYHDLILKIRAKYGLPLAQFSDDADNHGVTGRDGAKSTEMKKGLVSCHRCLIYLGDLARYKGLYGEGESRNRDYAAASSYYMQAAALLPSSGNPHHQLAILASYSGNELVAVYRYFRSLAAEIPFTTAKDNLIVAFEKNRQYYAQLLGKYSVSQGKESSGVVKADGDKEAISHSEETDNGGGVRSSKDKYRDFCIQFVRLNGIVFTRTSLEVFTELLTSVKTVLRELLSSGLEEEQNFGADFSENGLTVLRLVAILIFTVHNMNKKTEGLTYAEILQHTVLLQNAFTATFELMNLMVERCLQLRDPSSSFLLPGILVLLEWIACSSHSATPNDVQEKPAAAKLMFWKHCVALLNKLLSYGLVTMDDEGGDICFTEMTRYEEGETVSCHALWEDFELRGFLPLVPAQTILDFSKKLSISADGGNKEKKTRIKRILAAGKALFKTIVIDQKPVHFDSKVKQFVIGVEPQLPCNTMPSSDFGVPEFHMAGQEAQNRALDSGIMHANAQLSCGGDEEEEEIVFKPTQTDKQVGSGGFEWTNFEGTDVQCKQGYSEARSKSPVPAGNIALPQPHKLMGAHQEPWLEDRYNSLSNGSFCFGFAEDGQAVKSGVIGDRGVSPDVASLTTTMQESSNVHSAAYSDHLIASDAGMRYRSDTFAYPMVNADNLSVKTIPSIPEVLRSQVNRPVRHIGPPPGFSAVPSKQIIFPVSSSDGRNESLLKDDYGQLYGYQFPPVVNNTGSRKNLNRVFHEETHLTGGNTFSGTTSFPFPGKQVSAVPLQGANNFKEFQIYQPFANLNLNNDHKFPEQQNIFMGDQQFNPLPEHYQGQPTWRGRYNV